MLRIDVRKRLRDFTLAAAIDVPAGITVIVGSSGAGKTTLLRLVAGLERPDAGTIVLADRVLNDARTFVPAHERDVGVVFAEYALFPHLNAHDNVAFGLRARGVPVEERDERVKRIFDRLDIPRLARERVDRLSSGQRQRIALARALVIEPAALVLDEPLAALDPLTRARVRADLRDILADIAVPALLVTHDDDDRAMFPERIARIEHGHLRLASPSARGD